VGGEKHRGAKEFGIIGGKEKAMEEELPGGRQARAACNRPEKRARTNMLLEIAKE